MKNRQISILRVLAKRPGSAPAEGRLIVGTTIMPCRLGSAGVVRRKREGDCGTPAGLYRILGGFFRADRKIRSQSSLALRTLRPGDLWCDDPKTYAYNRHAVGQLSASHEKLWRDDRAYDVMLIVDYNHRPRKLGAGSAIFIHLTRPEAAATAGCVAIDPAAMRRLLPRLSGKVRLKIG